MQDFFPQVVFTIFDIPVRDTVISTWIMMVIIVGAATVVGRRRPEALEMLVDFLIDTVSGVIERPAGPYLPFLGTLTIFIAVANVLGVLPSIPLPDGKMLPIVSPTRDINTPTALALVVFFSVYYFGIREKGLWGYVKDMASPIFMLPMELISHVSRTLSLTLRLFGNIISTELIVAVIFALVPLFAPLLLVAFSMFTGILQAYIFTVLAAVYIGAGLESENNK
ncbi:MAG: F0F1 ATP synthase subunit A [Chloroflexota bacterium]|nr:F0F1 ATP synthase subunit A [Chloroflexota bacterium]